MIDAAMRLRVAGLGGTHLHAAMRADVEVDVNFIAAIARDDHLVLAHVADDEVAGLGDLGLVTEQQPGLGEDPVHFELVELVIAHHPQRHLIGIALYEIVERRAVVQRERRFLQHRPLLRINLLAPSYRLNDNCSRCKSE